MLLPLLGRSQQEGAFGASTAASAAGVLGTISGRGLLRSPQGRAAGRRGRTGQGGRMGGSRGPHRMGRRPGVGNLGVGVCSRRRDGLRDLRRPGPAAGRRDPLRVHGGHRDGGRPRGRPPPPARSRRLHAGRVRDVAPAPTRPGQEPFRSIVHLYYGSFVALAENDPSFDVEAELKETIEHEVQHHIEDRAGAKTLQRRGRPLRSAREVPGRPRGARRAGTGRASRSRPDCGPSTSTSSSR